MRTILYILFFLCLSINCDYAKASSSFLITFSKQKIKLPAQNKLTGLCNTLAANKPSGIYQFNINGSQFSTYCDMTHEGGGWTLVGIFISGKSWGAVSSLDLSYTGFINNLQIWNKLNSETNPIMLFSYETNFQDSAQIDYKKITGNICEKFNGFIPYDSNGLIFHSEYSGCNLTGMDYTIVRINRTTSSDFGVWGEDSTNQFYNISGVFFNYDLSAKKGDSKTLYIFIK